MIEVLEEKPLKLVSHCHLPPIWISGPHLAPDPTVFPAAVEGFETFLMVPRIGWSGGRYELVDVSGLAYADIKSQIGKVYPGTRMHMEAIRFLQCLDWIHKGDYRDKFSFERIVSYPLGAEAAVAVRVENGFKRIPYPGDEKPWEKGTLCLMSIDSL